MKPSTAASPDDYVASLRGWQRVCVENLRAVAHEAAQAEEAVKWGHLVYSSNGPAFLIRAESERVLFGFWRGKHLRTIEPRLMPGGRYEMATLELREGDSIAPDVARRLVKRAIALNKKLGDPRLERVMHFFVYNAN